MITLQLNIGAQVIELSEGGELVASLTFAEATRKGIRCVPAFKEVERQVEASNPDGTKRTQREVHQEIDLEDSVLPDLSALSAERGTMPGELRTGTTVQLPCIVVSRKGKKVADVMLPFDEDDLEE